MKVFVLLWALGSATVGLAQAQYNNWYFGFGAGITFDGGTPSLLDNNPFSTDEGSASISDADGELLFTTNGEVLYDRSLDPMPNGSGLGGHFSAAQSALIVPFVGEPGMYYVFTVPSQLATWGGVYSGLTYSVVDMSLNAGMGDVTLKNLQLQEQTTEHLTAVRHANGRDAWVVVHGWNSDTFYAYLITCTGIEGPVVSNAGEPLMQDIWDQYTPAIGCADISPLGDRLAITWSAFASENGRAHLDVLSFDNTTGIISDGFAVDHGGTFEANMRGYGVQFSPDGSRLYWSDNGLASGIGVTNVLQYDMEAADPASTEYVAATANAAFGTMQTGPDGMLYCATLDGTMHLTRLMAPNALGAACNFDPLGISTAPHMVTWGLGNNWDTFPEPAVPGEVIIPTDTLVCADESITLEALVDLPFETPQYTWSTGATTPTIVVTGDGMYHVEVTLSCDVVLHDSIEVRFSVLEATLGPDRLICEGDSVTLSGPANATAHVWSTGEPEASITPTTSGTYWLEVVDDIGCTVHDEVVLEFYDCTCPVFVPNAFTPDGDAINDVFEVGSNCPFKNFQLLVFDRWGHEVFTTEKADTKWTGDVPIGVYTWTASYEWPIADGTRKAEQRGHVTVVR